MANQEKKFLGGSSKILMVIGMILLLLPSFLGDYPIHVLILIFFFAYLVLSGKVQFWHILVLVPIFGFLKSTYGLCRQAYVFDLVGREELMNALALHSSGMNLARIIASIFAPENFE
jgi:hypothetical protein